MPDGSTIDSGNNGIDAPALDVAAQDTAATDTLVSDTGADAPTSDASDASDAGDGGCPSSWTGAPTTDPSLAIPDGGGSVLLHASGAGTQDYQCEAVTNDAGTSNTWVFVGPEADLDDCAQNKIGSHFASDGGAARPEWQTVDGTYVIGKKLVAFTPDGGGGAVPWLLLQEVTNGGTGVLSRVGYIQRLNTTGGVAPAGGCDAGALQKVPYTADYYFYGQ